MTIRIHNTLTGKKEEFVPLQEKKVGMYVCGVTVYDRCHIGHARAAVVFDIIFRFLRHLGYEVTYVRNYTCCCIGCCGAMSAAGEALAGGFIAISLVHTSLNTTAPCGV